MTIKDFINSKPFNYIVLFDIYDVDEFVLKVCRDLKNNYDVWDLKHAKRYSFEECQVEEGMFYQEEISTEEYLNRKKEEEDFMCYTKLNYEGFEKEFPINELEDWYGDEWLYKSCFLKTIFNWIDNIDSDSSKKIRLRDLTSEIKRSLFALKNIKNGWNDNIPLNEIQKEVIEIHKRFNSIILEEITSRYQDIFPEIFEKENIKNSNKETQTHDLQINPHPEIFKGNTYFKFKKYTENHIIEPYVDFSYLFQRMLDEKMIHRNTHKQFIEWLFENEFISEKNRNKFLDLRGFRSLTKSREDNRVNNFNNVFEI